MANENVRNSRIVSAVADLLYDYRQQKQRIHELEQELARKNDMLHGIEEFHRQDEVFVSDDLGKMGGEDKVAYAKKHVMKSASIDIGKMMLEKGYIGIREEIVRDDAYAGRWYRVHAMAVALKQVW